MLIKNFKKYLLNSMPSIKYLILVVIIIIIIYVDNSMKKLINKGQFHLL